MTYLGQLRMTLSFVPHDKPEMWGPMALHFMQTLPSQCGYVIWLEWVGHGDLDKTLAAMRFLRNFRRDPA